MKATYEGKTYEGTAEEVTDAVKMATEATVYAWKALSYEERLEVGRKVAEASDGRITLEEDERGTLAVGKFTRKDRQPLKYKTGAGWVYLNRHEPEAWLLRKPKSEKRTEDAPIVPERRAGEPKPKKRYAVTIADDASPDGSPMICEAVNKTDARKQGRAYIKAWGLHHAKITAIEEVPAESEPAKNQAAKNPESAKNSATETAKPAKNQAAEPVKNHEPETVETVKNPDEEIIKLHRPKKLMQSLYRMTSKDETRRILCTVHFEPGCMVATDSYRLAYVPFEYEGEPFELPNELVKILAKRIAFKSDAEIIVKNDKIGVRCTSTKGEQIEEFAAKIDGRYPDWRQLEQETYTSAVDIEPKNFAECVKRCSIAVSKVEPIAIITDGKNAVMGAKTPNVVSAREDLGMVASGKPAKIALNWMFLKDAVSLFDHPVQIRLNEPLNPAVITDGNAWVLIMPVREDESYFKGFEPKSTGPKSAGHHEVKTGTSFCFTGGLKSMTRKTAERKLRERGFDVSHNVNKSTDYLVIADASIGKSSSKMRTAKKYDTPVMSESEFMALVA